VVCTMGKETSLLRKAIAEFIGVFLFVFTGCGACASCCLKVVPGGAPIEYALGPIAFSFGLAIMVLVFCTADISGGHLNPAVSFSFLVTGKQSPVEFVVYVIAQVLGAICAGFFLMGVLPEDYHKIDSTHATVLGTQAITNITLPQAVLVEIVTTFTLVFTVWANAVDEKSPAGLLAPVPIGFAVILGILASGNLSGGSMNPARSIGPAVATQTFDGQWVYWVVPMIGAALAGLLYKHAFLSRNEAEQDERTFANEVFSG